MILPQDARPHEVAILRVYLQETFDPREIASILHYEAPQPVYRVIRKYRDFLSEQRAVLFSGSLTITM
jgi:hypothetical protein